MTPTKSATQDREPSLAIDNSQRNIGTGEAESKIPNDAGANNIESARLAIEQQRLELETLKTRLDHRFWSKNSGTIITAIVSLVAVIISATQIWVANISKQKEMNLIEAQKNREIAMMQDQRQTAQEQQNREWSLSLAKFVMENRKGLFAGTPEEIRVFANTIPTVFPKELAGPLLGVLEQNANSPTARDIWRKARTTYPTDVVSNAKHLSLPSNTDVAVLSPGKLLGYVSAIDTGQPIEGATIVARNETTKAEYEIRADGNGSFDFSLPPGPYAITLSRKDYRPNVGYACIVEGQSTRIDFGRLLHIAGNGGVNRGPGGFEDHN